ncbi:hypothetical protein Bca52824_082973 [Brassica carinata]|uniref:Uncharacterized protein n=1 Tax=Brassica carinata TaxID=52824 RepID=A0A8X7PLE5_BRACI|nr:hypothetical protein Bca52824_082973 [Brassica carinata]
MVAENTYPHPGYVDSSSYETEFADATIAAHAAAESAERASGKQPIKDDVNDSCSKMFAQETVKLGIIEVHTQAMFLMTITSSLRINDLSNR